MHKRLLRQLLASSSKASGLGHGWRQTAGSAWGRAGLPAASCPLVRTWVQVWVSLYAPVGKREMSHVVRRVFVAFPLLSIWSWWCHRGVLPSHLLLCWLWLCEVRQEKAQFECRALPTPGTITPHMHEGFPCPWSHRHPASLE